MATFQGDGGYLISREARTNRFILNQGDLLSTPDIVYPTYFGTLPSSLGGGSSYGLGRDDARPAPRGITSTPSPTSPTSGSDSSAGSAVDRIAEDFKAENGGGGSKTKSPTTVPLWQVRPKSVTASGDDSISRLRRQAQADADLRDKIKTLTVPIDQAKAAYLDMSAAERKKLRDMLMANGEIDANDTDADVMNKWAQWVDRAVSYNTGKDPSQYISPWEAIGKLGAYKAAGEGGAINGTGFPHKIDDKSTTTQTFTLDQIQSVAEGVLQATLKRNPNKQELERYLAAINQAAKDNPVVQHTTGTAYGEGRQVTTTTQSGGVDDNARTAIMLNMARADPYYAETQAATTYFDAVMQALNSPVQM